MEKSSSQGRFYVLDGPVASPGVCAICGYGGRERRYLDPRLDFEFYGSVIFCETCIGSMAQEFGLLTRERVVEIEDRVESLETELIKLRAVTAASEAFNVAVRAYTGETVSGSGSWVTSGDSGPAVFEPDESSSGNVEAEPSGESPFDVSSLSEGPDDVFDLGDSDSDSSLKL